MDIQTFGQVLAAHVGAAHVRFDAPLAPFTTFKVGGPADILLTVTSIEELSHAVALASAAAVPVHILGGGSNLLVADAGVRGLVIRLMMTGIDEVSSGRVRAAAGATMNGLVRWTVGRGLAGLEAWAGTPGTVGGAICGNAHYAGRNISEIVVDVGLVTPHGQVSVASRDAMSFAYDTSRVQQSGEVVVWAEFQVTAGDPDSLRAVARQSLAHRKGTQPLASPSAGCAFQNPERARDRVPDDIPASAGALIDRAGLKGHRVGGAEISTVHANFIVNSGGATAADIDALMQLARSTVRERFGVTLRDEVMHLGDWPARSPSS